MVCAEEPQIVVDYENDIVIISGKSTGDMEGRIVSLCIINPGKQMDNMFSESYVINWCDVSRIGSNGNYVFELKIVSDLTDGADKKYTAVIGIDGEENEDIIEFEYFSGDDKKAIIDLLQKAVKNNDIESAKSVLENNRGIFQLEENLWAEYDLLSADNKNTFLNGMLKNNLLSIDDIAVAIQDTLDVIRLKNCVDKESYAAELIEILSSNNSAGRCFENYKKEEQLTLAEIIKNSGEYLTKYELRKSFYNLIILYEMDKDMLWNELISTIQRFNDILAIDFNKYNSLKNKSIAVQGLLNIEFLNLEDVIKQFNSVVEKQLKKEKQNINGIDSSLTGKKVGSSNNVIAASETVKVDGKLMFSDLIDFKWAEKSIEILTERNIVSGDENGNFNPSNKTTRAELVKMAALAFDIPVHPDDNKVIAFSDVSNNDWYYTYVLNAYKKGIIQGISDRLFKPNDSIFREDAAVIICRAVDMGNNNPDAKTEFADNDSIAVYARSAIDFLFKHNIVTGFDDNTFRPKQFATRAEIAVMVVKTIDYIEKR